ncbi:hypothetical protein BD289DRAFT_436845 [Coniella lustricola]|uniref:U6 snRNA phosphodiesterase n=1 Tax=Coniella lustricola TaxID=2025994 RepID=A0A2T3A4R0_9PEZI|nr:hypothetical protein BD289DRAFT_436845 [Coniella lustricola]
MAILSKMGLVDYDSSCSSSSSSSSSSSLSTADRAHRDHRPAKKRKTSATTIKPSSSHANTSNNSSNNTTALPPLPSAFHNLYASTVRPAAADLPSLHQGRRRLIPHVAGNWPSHLYIEWRPTPAAHEALTSLLNNLTTTFNSLVTTTTTTTTSNEVQNTDTSTTTTASAVPELTSFLTSDLGAPLPLHVSLSRPFVLRTAEKDRFLDDLVQALHGSGSVNSSSPAHIPGPFSLVVDDVAWFRSREAERSFLVLRVRSSASNTTTTTTTIPSSYPSTTQDGAEVHPATSTTKIPPRNPELTAILNKCNDLVGAYGQPKLYAQPAQHQTKDTHLPPDPPSKNQLPTQNRSNITGDTSASDNGHGGGVQDTTTTTTTDQAFHVSIAWSFFTPTDELRAQTAAVFAKKEFQRAIREAVRIPVDSVKAKIGNVVSDIPLVVSGAAPASGAASAKGAGGARSGIKRGLFGL